MLQYFHVQSLHYKTQGSGIVFWFMYESRVLILWRINMLKKNYRGNSGKGIFQASLVSGFLMELLRLLKSIENEIGLMKMVIIFQEIPF